MMKRQIITIEETKEAGCGDCIPVFPTAVMQVETREAEPYDERCVMAESIVKAGPNVIAAPLCHMEEHGETGYLLEAPGYLREQGIAKPLAEGQVPC